MGYLQHFTVTVLLVSFLCFICESLTAEGALGKYSALVTGLVISLAIVSALLQIRDVHWEQTDVWTASEDALQTDTQSDAVSAQFAYDLKAAVETAIFEKFGTAVVAEAHVSCAGEVITVERLTLQAEPAEAAAITDFVTAQFGIVPTVN